MRERLCILTNYLLQFTALYVVCNAENCNCWLAEIINLMSDCIAQYKHTLIKEITIYTNKT